MNILPWIVYSNSHGFYRVVARFGTRPEAEMHRQTMNRLNHQCNYKVCWDEAVKVVA